MFFLHELERTITLHPSFFGPRIHEYLRARLLQDVEGTNTGNYYIVCVLGDVDFSEGRVLSGSGFAEYHVTYRAVVWRPFKGETLDGIVTSVVNNGFFVDVGPLSVFVSVQMIPSDIKFDGNATPPQFTDNADQVIEKNTHVRVKIKGIRGEVGQMYAIATIKEDYLGQLSQERQEGSSTSSNMSDRFEQHDGTIPSADNSNASRASTSSHPELTRSSTSTSTTSLFLEHIHDKEGLLESNKPYKDRYDGADNVKSFEDFDIEEANTQRLQTVDLRWKRWLWSIAVVSALGWLVTLGFLIRNGAYKHRSTFEHDPAATVISGTGKKISVEQLQRGLWFPQSHAIEWIGGPNGEDGLLLEMQGAPNSDYLVVSDVRKGNTDSLASDTITLMKQGSFETSSGEMIFAQSVWPSPDLKTVLVMSEKQKNWRHSYTGLYWLFDVESQTGQALDLGQAEARIQLALWSPTSDAVVFTRDNNMFLRRLDSDRVVQVTNNGGDQMFNGVPDWVYEEEVFSGNSATWWSGDGKYIAFLATNESQVPEYPVQYFISRPSGSIPKEGLENYPEVRQIKYPKAGAPNPSVSIRFYDLNEDHVFDIPIARDFTDAQRLITEVIWAGKTGKVLVRETSRESDVLKMVLMDVVGRTGSIVREQNVMELDGGWFEISETTTFVPADPANGRPYDGYIDTVIYENYDHLGYFAPLDNPEPLLLTTGQWEVENAPSALDIAQNCVYFIATKEGSIQRHVYKVNLDGSNLESITDISKEGYYSASFSKGAGYALLSYKGPGIPWQKVISTPGTSPEYEHLVEDNRFLGQMAKEYELPIKVFSTISIDGLELNVVERRPPHFDKRKKYPVLFYLYGGPGSQTVDKKFSVDFQSYVAATLGYIVVTVDGRGTGLIGRKARTIVRGNLGYWEAHDQIETAKLWAQKSYVDPTRIAIWGWSYGGFMTLKTLEQDAGRTFRYGMAVAPVTDWAFYDTIYTERYMHTPQHNPGGYSNASISNTTALSQNVRFLVMHGVADDNVHMQNTLALLDELDLNGVENYDVHFFPDSDHSIYFHNANWIVYDKLSWWLTNAFNGEWAKIKDVQPLREGTLVGSNS